MSRRGIIRRRSPRACLAVASTFAFLLAATVLTPPFQGTADAAPKLGYFKVANASQPTSLASPPGHPRILFVTERAGKVRILFRGRWVRRPLLDLSRRVRSLAIEQGLLGLAFSSDFRRTGRFYISLTGRNGDLMIEEFRTRRGRPGRIRRGSRRLVLRIPKVAERGNHNGGHLEFVGRQLFIGVGDGNDPGDYLNKAQDLGSLRGKILRIDPRPNRRAGRAYRIPRGNPLVGVPGRNEIFAWGFRNPYGFDFHRPGPRGTKMVISDVGQERFEELNYLPFWAARGANFGWNDFEAYAPYDCGELCPNGSPPGSGVGLTWPQLTYSHDEGCAIIAGPVVEDPRLSSIRGRIIYGDFCGNRIRTAAPRTGLITDDRPIGFFLPPGRGRHSALNGFGEDGFRRIYAFSNQGGIYRIFQRR